MKTLSWLLFTALILMNLINFVNFRARAAKFQFTKNEQNPQEQNQAAATTPPVFDQTQTTLQNGLNNKHLSIEEDKHDESTNNDNEG